MAIRKIVKIKKVDKYWSRPAYHVSNAKIMIVLKHDYKYTNKQLIDVLSYKIRKKYLLFERALARPYNWMMIKDFDNICQIMPRHTPLDVYNLIFPKRRKNQFSLLMRQIEETYKNEKYDFEVYKLLKQDKSFEYLKNIVEAETFEFRQEAIKKAEAFVKNITFNAKF